MAAVAELLPAADQELLELPLKSLIAAADNPRRDVGDVAELAMSIKSVGLLEPIVATPRGDGYYTVVAGHRRLAAAELAALDTVPVFIRVFDDQERIAAMLVENLQRSDLQPLEEAGAFRRLVDEFGIGQRQLAEKVGRSQGHISKRLALLDLPANVQTAIDSGGISIADALELTKLKGMPKRLASAFSNGARWGNYTQAVRDELHEHERAEKVGAATQKLKQTGVTIVAFTPDQYGHSYTLPKGAIRLDRWEARELKLTPANHKNQPCHAAAVDPNDGDTVWVCTKPASHKGTKLAAPADEQERARKEREAEKRAQLKAREKNLELGATLAAKLEAPAIDATNMRLLAEVLMHEIGSELAQTSFLYTDEASQTVLTKKDGTVSRIVHVEGSAARKLLDGRLAAAKTPEQIMGVLLQAMLTTKLADRQAVPQSRRHGYVGAIESDYRGPTPARKLLDSIAASVGKSTRAKKRSA